MGSFPLHCTSRVPVLFDLRCICMPIQIYAVPQSEFPLSVFMQQAGLVLPSEHRLEVSGILRFDEVNRTVRV